MFHIVSPIVDMVDIPSKLAPRRSTAMRPLVSSDQQSGNNNMKYITCCTLLKQHRLSASHSTTSGEIGVERSHWTSFLETQTQNEPNITKIYQNVKFCQGSTRSTSPDVGPGESQGSGEIHKGAAQTEPQLPKSGRFSLSILSVFIFFSIIFQYFSMPLHVKVELDP